MARQKLAYLDRVLEFSNQDEAIREKYQRQRMIQQMHLRSLYQVSELIRIQEPIAATMSK
ncbi:hypothetical protein [Priestia taiwanensis]|uniref:hypothetical protein n=1 Tax=Priestia taiwanensis TaxID=1347902 RepID=UPI001662E5AC|nr:hypothetical protein [Priestia taiwanensis]MBM7362714.1 membrane protein insertase Oxa1/YidC/SpoIIIJ [Priestia taiwanensis]